MYLRSNYYFNINNKYGYILYYTHRLRFPPFDILNLSTFLMRWIYLKNHIEIF